MRQHGQDILVPPFQDSAATKAFLRQLAFHLGSLDDDAVTFPTFLLLSTLDELGAVVMRREDTAPPPPLSPVILHLALRSQFPAPWTPGGIHAALAAGDRWTTAPPAADDAFSAGDDPIIEARRGRDNRWTILRHERGTTDTLREGLTDEDYVQCLLDDTRAHPFPYGWQVSNVPGLDTIVSGANRVRQRWNDRFAPMPYLRNWIAQRDAARARESGGM